MSVLKTLWGEKKEPVLETVPKEDAEKLKEKIKDTLRAGLYDQDVNFLKNGIKGTEATLNQIREILSGFLTSIKDFKTQLNKYFGVPEDGQTSLFGELLATGTKLHEIHRLLVEFTQRKQEVPKNQNAEVLGYLKSIESKLNHPLPVQAAKPKFTVLRCQSLRDWLKVPLDEKQLNSDFVLLIADKIEHDPDADSLMLRNIFAVRKSSSRTVLSLLSLLGEVSDLEIKAGVEAAQKILINTPLVASVKESSTPPTNSEKSKPNLTVTAPAVEAAAHLEARLEEETVLIDGSQTLPADEGLMTAGNEANDRELETINLETINNEVDDLTESYDSQPIHKTEEINYQPKPDYSLPAEKPGQTRQAETALTEESGINSVKEKNNPHQPTDHQLKEKPPAKQKNRTDYAPEPIIKPEAFKNFKPKTAQPDIEPNTDEINAVLEKLDGDETLNLFAPVVAGVNGNEATTEIFAVDNLDAC